MWVTRRGQRRGHSSRCHRKSEMSTSGTLRGVPRGMLSILLQPLKSTWLLLAETKRHFWLRSLTKAQIPTVSALLSYCQAPEEHRGAGINDKKEKNIVTSREMRGEKGNKRKDSRLRRELAKARVPAGLASPQEKTRLLLTGYKPVIVLSSSSSPPEFCPSFSSPLRQQQMMSRRTCSDSIRKL